MERLDPWQQPCPRCGQLVVVRYDGILALHNWPPPRPGQRIIRCAGSLLPARRARA